MPKALKVVLTVIGIILGVAVAAYVAVAVYMNGRFFPNTTLNDVDVSLMTKAEAKNAILDKMNGYSLTILDNFGRKEVFSKDELGLTEGDMDRLDMIRESQKPYYWIESLYTTYVFEDTNLLSVDEEKILENLGEREVIKHAGGIKSEDAYITFDEEKKSFAVVPEVYGDIIDTQNLVPIMNEYASKLMNVLDTRVAGGYHQPKVLSTDETLNKNVELFNQYSGASIKYEMKGAEEYIGPNEYVEWFVTDGDKVSVDRNKVKAFVNDMAKKYDTYGTERSFITSWGDTVTLSTKEEYGWEIDQEKEVAQLMNEIMGNKAVVRDFNYLHEAESHGNTDLGDTYIEVNFTKQHLYLYKDGKVVMDTDVVTGNTGAGMGTPTGIYHIYNKAKNRYLVGETYRSWVYYWMPFYKAYGLHDATWRRAFGGEIYKRGGSHGCVNLPLEKAGELYDNIEVGYLVITYYED